MDKVYREILGIVKRIRVEAPQDEMRAAAVSQHLWEVHERALRSLDGWSGPYASEAGEYYYNEVLKVSTWECPVTEWEHELAVRHAVLCKCLIPDHYVVGADGSIGAVGTGLAGGGTDLLQALQLPLNLVRRDSSDQPMTPSTSRSFHTARSIASTRSQQLSGRSGDRSNREKASGSTNLNRSPGHANPPPQAPSPPVEAGHGEDGPTDFTFGSMDHAAWQQRLAEGGFPSASAGHR